MKLGKELDIIKQQTAYVKEKSNSYCRKRECICALKSYISGPYDGRVFILYGLERTGKTTLMRQCMADMTEDQLSRTAYLETNPHMNIYDMNASLACLERERYRYVFIDGVTSMEDFIEGAALFSDIYAASGMKIVLSGKDSLGFRLAVSDQLYDRAIMMHTTFISYREFEEVLGMHGIDGYIRFGGTMDCSIGSSFSSDPSVVEYVESAIVENIEHSLKCCRDGFGVGSLPELHDGNGLDEAINRVLEDIERGFLGEVLKGMLDYPGIPEKDASFVNGMLGILIEEDLKRDNCTYHDDEIMECLHLLDFAEYVDVMHLPDSSNVEKRTVISQSGIRYAHADALVKSLMMDEKFNMLSIEESSYIVSRIRSEIMGRMMEDAILLETKLAYPDKKVFKLQFAVGEFDMVVFDPETLSSSIYEIKHSSERVEAQYRHLVDEEKIRLTEHRFGHIEKRSVIYRGETVSWNGIEYVNAEEYLKSLPAMVRIS